jgi:hypothetical protein
MGDAHMMSIAWPYRKVITYDCRPFLYFAYVVIDQVSN